MDNKKLDRETLKSYFKSGAIPTESNFSDLIDGILNQSDDQIIKRPGEPLSIAADGDSMSLQKLINFYQNLADPQPKWLINLNPRSDPKDPATSKAGLSIGDGQSTSRLFIDAATGNLGVGTINPLARLEVEGDDRHIAITNSKSTTKLAWTFTNWTDDKLYIQAWKGKEIRGNILILDENLGLQIDHRKNNNAGLWLTSESEGWGSGMVFKNTKSNGREWGVYSGSDGQLHFADNAAARDVIQVASQKVVVYGTLIIETSQGTWGFQDDGNLCFKNRTTGATWCVNSNDTVFEKARKG
ncbi:MAG: hypothetical protein FIA97_02030 [Methylococcaceae bacterium]|nr:hypothetical protein [Methylococcaceae bacterium]